MLLSPLSLNIHNAQGKKGKEIQEFKYLSFCLMTIKTEIDWLKNTDWTAFITITVSGVEWSQCTQHKTLK